MIKNFYTFTVYKSKSISWAISALLVFLIIWFLSMTTNGLIKVIIALILVLVFVYSQGVKIEKSVAQVMKRYDKKNGTVIKTTFYEDHLCVYQNGSPTHYAYIQLSDLKFNKDFVYLYQTNKELTVKDLIRPVLTFKKTEKIDDIFRVIDIYKNVNNDNVDVLEDNLKCMFSNLDKGFLYEETIYRVKKYDK